MQQIEFFHESQTRKQDTRKRIVHESQTRKQDTRKGCPYYTRTSMPSCIVGVLGDGAGIPGRADVLFPLLPILFLLLLATGCQFTQSPFVLTVGNAGSEFAAASTTLTYAHTGKITVQYAQASFVNYQSQLNGLDQQLPSQQGVPDKQTIKRLIAVYGPAMRAVNRPCLQAGCDWRAQVVALNRASQAFLKAGSQ